MGAGKARGGSRRDVRGPAPGSGGRRAIAAAIVAALLCAGGARVACAEQATPQAHKRGLAEQFGLATIAGIGTLVYFPLKLAYACVGGVVGGLTYVLTLGDEDVANTVWEATLGGSYVLTPEMVAGEEHAEFAGGMAPPEATPAPAKDGNSGGQWPD